MAVYQSLTLTQLSQNIEANTSQVRILWQSTQTGSSYNMIAHDANFWVCINSQPEEIHTVTYYLPQNTTHTIADTVITVPHNDKGEAMLQVRTQLNTRLTAGVIELSEQLTLDTIPRASTLMATDAMIGGISRLVITKRNSSYSHSIRWEFGGLTGYVTQTGGTVETESVFAGDCVDFCIPESLYIAIPDRQNGVCTMVITTYDGENRIGQPQTAAFTVAVDEVHCCPVVAGSVRDTCEATLALTGDGRKLVRYVSAAECYISAYARKNALVTEKRIQGIPVAEDSITIAEFDAQSVRFEMTDSRGFTAIHTEPVELIPYVKLTCDATAEREDPVSGNAVLYISGDCYVGGFGVQDNAVTVCYSIDGGEIVTLPPMMTEDNRYYASASLTGMDYTRLYSITVWVSDKLNRLEKRTTLKKGVPVFDWGEEDFAFHVPVQMDGTLDVAGKLSLGGKGIIDLFYPIHSVYTTVSTDDLSDFLGGKWVRLEESGTSVIRWKRIS